MGRKTRLPKRFYKDFPNLGRKSFRVTSPRNKSYNCIAWAAKDTKNNWWPSEDGYWPVDEYGGALDAIIECFTSMGFVKCRSTEFERGFEKIAIFVGTTGEPTHVSRQLGRAYWTSKLGKGVDIRHKLEGLRGPCYGQVSVVMRRKKR